MRPPQKRAAIKYTIASKSGQTLVKIRRYSEYTDSNFRYDIRSEFFIVLEQKLKY